MTWVAREVKLRRELEGNRLMGVRSGILQRRDCEADAEVRAVGERMVL